MDALLAEIDLARGGDARLDDAVDRLREELADPDELEHRARSVVELAALCLQGSLLVRHAPAKVADAFCGTRLGDDGGRAYGTLPRGTDLATGEKLLDAGTGRATFDVSVPIGRVLPHGRFAARLRMSDALTGVDSSFARPSFATVALEASTIFYSTRAVFAVRNLFDASYREPLSFIPEPGRTFAVSLRRDFDFALGH